MWTTYLASLRTERTRFCRASTSPAAFFPASTPANHETLITMSKKDISHIHKMPFWTNIAWSNTTIFSWTPKLQVTVKGNRHFTRLMVGINVDQWGINTNCSLIQCYHCPNWSRSHFLHGHCNGLPIIRIQSWPCTLRKSHDEFWAYEFRKRN